MKQEQDMKRLGYVGNIHQKGTADDDEYYQTYASELTLSEKDGKMRKRTVVVDKTRKVPASKPKEGEKTKSFTTISWIICFIIVAIAYTTSKNGKENTKRLLTDEACLNHKCQNGGTCEALMDGGYTCNCPVHIDGKFCESPHSNYNK